MPPPAPIRAPVRGKLVLALAFLCAGTTAGAEPAGTGDAPAVWPQRLFNPKPLPDDLILPLPCGGALAFRPVATPAGSARTALVGPFAGADGTTGRYLLIGKYEVTTLQYLTVTAQVSGGPCPTAAALIGDASVTAQVGVSRIDAVNFAAQLSRWLAANAQRLPPCEAAVTPCLPRVEGKPAFVRLPLESEWEYAARGGAAVSDEVFAQSRYPMPEGLERHAWFNRNADGEIAPIGRRLPNPLGLHDLYGNAWESMNDAYRSEEFPGQVGGDVLKGGGIHSTDDELRADRRVEVQPYDAAGDVRTADTGFRVVLAAPVVTSMGRVPVRERDETQRTDAAERAVTHPVAPVRAPVAAGHLLIHVDASAIVLVDGEVKGAAGVDRPLELTGLALGAHTIEARAAGYPVSGQEVDLPGAEPVEVHVHMEPTPERTESLLRLTASNRRLIVEQLSELGFLCRLTQDQFGQDFRRVLREFQRLGGLPPTGHMTTETRTLIERRIAQRNKGKKPEGQGAPADGVTPPPPNGRYLQFPEPHKGSGMDWMDPAPP